MVLRALRSPNVWALLLACLLSAAWVTADWSNLSALRLPDTDDAMRLQQVRDWIAGQPVGDVSQHRVAGGLPMHWSRIGDLVPAAIILLLRGPIGQPGAELTAVILWPLVQFAALLMLVRSIVHAIAPRAATTALAMAALAYPAASLFMPGRIDHHALQVVLVLVQLRALIAPPTPGSGAIAGGTVALGAAIGLETLPFAVVTGGAIVLGWLRGRGKRQVGFGLALAIGTLLLLPIAGRGGACDTIAPLAPAAIAGALALAALGRITQHKLAWLVAAGTALAILAWPAAQPCLAGPYGEVDPLVAKLWLARVGEAQPLLAAPFAESLGYAGLLLAGLVAGVWLARRGERLWLTVLAYQIVAVAITLAQLRGAYVGALLAVLPIAVLLAEQRARGRIPSVLALWIVGTGVTYPIVAGLSAPKGAQGAPTLSCTTPGALARLGSLPAGTVMAGIDLGAFAVASTHHGVIAAPYHRNNAGNAAMYRFFLAHPDVARGIARRWSIDYVAICDTDAGALDPQRIAAGDSVLKQTPAWLRPLPQSMPGLRLFAVSR